MFPWMGKLYLTDQTEPPLIVYNAFPIEEIRVRSTFIYLKVGITSVMECFIFTSEIVSDGFLTHTHYLSLCLYLFSPLIMKQTGLHSVRCITSVLISVHYSESCLTFMRSDVVTWGYFANESQPAVCMQNAVSDDLQ